MKFLLNLTSEVLRYALCVLLFATGIGKLLDVPGFIRVIETYEFFPSSFIPYVAVGMVLVELKIAESLLFSHRVSMAALYSVYLHLAFLLWSLTTLMRGLIIPNCGCFGVFWARPLTYWTLLEDAIMVLVSCYIYYCRKLRVALEPVSLRSSAHSL